MHDPLTLAIIFLFGIIIGSFLNVVIYRLPQGKSIVNPPSSCPACGKRIEFYDNIPLLSYLVLRGRCRSCGARISPRYPLVEFLAGFSAVFATYNLGAGFAGFEAVFLSFLFIAIFFIDLDHTIIPDVFTYPGIVIGFAVSFIPGGFVDWKQSAIGIVVGGGAFFLVRLLGRIIFGKEALGLGDVKFAAMLGAFLGWQRLLLVLVLASFMGSIVGIALIMFSEKGRKSYIPFGPFLVAGAWITIFYGKIIIDAYLELVGL